MFGEWTKNWGSSFPTNEDGDVASGILQEYGAVSAHSVVAICEPRLLMFAF
jgi:hypothetical protein